MSDVVIDEEIFKHRQIDGEWWLAPKGNLNASLMLILSHPNKEDCAAGELLSKDSAYRIEILNALQVAGISTKNIYVTCMVKHGIGGLAKPNKSMIEKGYASLDYEINLVKPKLIMSLGAEVFKRIMQANKKQGDYLGEIIQSPYGNLFPNYSPGMIINQDPTLRAEFRDNFIVAGKFLNDTLNYKKFTYEVVSDIARSKEVIKDYISKECFNVGYDAEWFGDKIIDNEVMYTFQYCCEPHHAIILDISKDGITENLELLNTVKPLLEHPKVKRLGWNIRADDKRLILRGFNLPEETLGFDGMKACAFIDSRLPKGLETGIKKFTEYEPYYNAFNKLLEFHKLKKYELSKLKLLNSEAFYNYCAGDAVSHREACLNMMQVMDELPEQVKNYYYDVYLPLTNYFIDLELHGIPIDTEVMNDITVKYTSKYHELKAELSGLIEHIIPDFNPASSPQKKELLYNILKLDPPYYTKSGKAAKSRAWYLKQKDTTKSQYQPSTNNKSLSTLKFELTEIYNSDPANEEVANKLKIISILLSLNRVNVFANKFLSRKGTSFLKLEDDDEEEEPLKSSYWAALCSDNRIRADFFECLTNFRSSSKPNVQNPASKVLSHIPEIFVPGYNALSKEEKKEADKTIVPNNLRHIFYPGKPGWSWVEVDVAGADLAIAAFLSKDSKYIKDILNGGFHLTKAREYFRDPNLTKNDVAKYVSSKSITFRVAYTSELLVAAIPIQSEIFAESGILVDLKDIEYALNTWNNYTRYMEYREECKRMVDEKACIINNRGLIYHFDDTENFGIKAGWYNESLAFPIASELALFLWEVSVKIKERLKKDGVWNKYCFPVNSVHDASYWIISNDLIKDNYFPEICKDFFTKSVSISTGDNLGMEMIVSDRWKGKNKLFEAETEWNFSTNEWEWKK